MQLFGRHVALPALLAPHALVFKVRWSENDPRPPVEQPTELDTFEHGLYGLKSLVWVLLALLIVALPVASIGFGAGVALLAVFAAYYLLVVVALLLVYRRRVALRLSGRSFASLAVDVLACAPFAVNLINKLSLQRGIAGNPLAFARIQFPPLALAEVRALVAAALAPDLEAAAAESPQRAALERLLTDLEPQR